MDVVEIIFIVAGVGIVVAVLISRTAHANVTIQKTIRIDGTEREQWTFNAGYSNTLIGQTFGRAYCAIQSARFSCAKARRERAITTQ